ncbi:MAG: pantetheine-phosphate adenylyltransferase [Thermoanaerobaculia bacterium]
MDKKIAVYAGSFDPIHNGHIDIIKRGLKIFDEIIVAILINEEKSYLFSIEERVRLIKKSIKHKNLKVETFSGLLVDFMKLKRARVILRGLRAVSDFEYEFQMALMNHHLNPEIETFFMVPKEEYTYLSSKLVKEVVKFGGDVSSLIPKEVQRALINKLK